MAQPLWRAVSTAYYGLFHFLIDQSSRFLVGSTGDREAFRKVLARAYLHGEMASAAKSFRGGTLPASLRRSIGTLTIPRRLRILAERFINAQDARHLADYDLSASFVRSDIIDLIDAIERTIRDWAAIRSEPASRFFLICLLTWDRIRAR